MICSHCRDVVLDISRGVAHPEEAAAHDHLSGCAACSQYLQQQRELTAGLRALAATPDEVQSDAMERRFTLAVAVLPAGTRRPHVTSGFGRWLKVAAAIVLAASVFALWQWHERVPPDGATRIAGHPQLPVSPDADRAPAAGGPGVAQAMPAANTETTALSGGSRHFVAARSPARAARPRIVQATGFVALPAAAMLPPFERGEIVRVQVRLATLANLGFTVQPDAVDSTPINADLLVGQDGQPRAIRLVTDTQASRSRR